MNKFDKRLRELNRLEDYLKKKHVGYKRVDENGTIFDRHQIIVWDKDGKYSWDAICHRGSYGYERGLIEVMGDAVAGDEEVIGYLTAQDVIDILEGRKDGKI